MSSAENPDGSGWLGGIFDRRRSDTYPPWSSGATAGFPNFPNHIAQHWLASNKIYFYHKHEPFYGFTNFSPHSVVYKGKKYPTSEHLFQSFKFTHKPKLAEHIRTCSSRPSVAFSEARRFAPEVREDWVLMRLSAQMETTIYNKFMQHKDIRRQLLATGDAELIENSDKDSYWGCGADGKGQNELGKALERLRTRLRKERR
ncbi:hypothetical protein BJ322DRAFT_998827 [Thelephora terrestris]|uniref:NADAR domain-containing protein n=1 Tax=Thelephora terrestris TaxID=56493 RepID=A0A9P6LBA1_9AGAM|nr:hypothetical protein BJ322DRAFT_998827 [Thelephora terrestris]